MTEFARRTWLSPAQPYRSFSSDGNPTLDMTMADFQAVGIQLLARQAETGKE